MWRQILFVVWTVSMATLHGANAVGTKRQPHIVFVLADDYGFHDVGYHGSEIRTPNLDRLSAQGVRLENYYVQPICTPSRSQLMSGRYQIHTGLQHKTINPAQPNALPTGNPTLADQLRQAGYATHMVGKWHLGFYKKQFLPTNRGFDTFYGFYTGHSDHYSHKTKYLDGNYYLDLHDQDKPVRTEAGHYSTHLFTKKAVERIRGFNSSKPMFLYLAYQAVHNPLEAPEEYVTPYEKTIKNVKRRKYAAMVTAMDEGVGNVTQALQDSGMWDNTVFIFSSDNGGTPTYGASNYPLRGQKRDHFEGGVRAVGFINAFNLTTAGTVSKELIHISDWFPTLVNIAGGSLKGTKPLDGVDQWKTISEGHASARTELLHNIDPKTSKRGAIIYNNTFDHRIQAALRVGDWKLITGNPGKGDWTPAFHRTHGYVRPVSHDSSSKNLWLFNITADPTEEHDLSAKHPNVVKKMLDKLQNYYKTSVPVSYPPYNRKGNPKYFGGVYSPWQ